MMLFSLLVVAANPQAPDHPMTGCPATPARLPAGLEGWSRKQPVRGAAAVAAATMLPLGIGVEATLLRTSKITYAVRPVKPGGDTSSGGLFAFLIPFSGRYRVELGAGAWIDVLQGSTLATSVAHAHGPDCTGVRKMVDFDLTPGRYVLQVAGSDSTILRLMVSRLP